MRTERFDFTGADGQRLSARFDQPDAPPRATALFAHCFTCGKDIFAAGKIAEALAADGVATLRFDFTGLGHSDGEFANTTFSSNVDDLVAAADHLRGRGQPPAILIGHSLGGAAVIAAAHRIAEAKAVATIGAPADPEHVTHNFAADLSRIERDGEAEVTLAGRRFTIKKAFLDDLAAQRQADRIADLRRALLVMHAPTDDVVGVDNATRIFVAAKHPKAFVGLDGASHLLGRKRDAAFVGQMIAAWAQRYVDAAPAEAAPQAAPGAVVVTANGRGPYGQTIVAGAHRLAADEPKDVGGLDAGPGPYELLLSALGACTAMTMRMYADRKKWPLTGSSVTLRHRKIDAADCADCETKTGKVDEIERRIALEGPLDAEQRDRLLEIADKCPVHRTLSSEVKVRTALADD